MTAHTIASRRLVSFLMIPIGQVALERMISRIWAPKKPTARIPSAGQIQRLVFATAHSKTVRTKKTAIPSKGFDDMPIHADIRTTIAIPTMIFFFTIFT